MLLLQTGLPFLLQGTPFPPLNNSSVSKPESLMLAVVGEFFL